jgi:ATP-binding cassette subfamily F protein 3
MVQIEGIRRQYGPHVLFDGLSWLIPRGARCGLVGPNGAGKTTLLRILTGQEEPDAGRVHRPSTLRIGYLPQEVETVEQGSVLEIVLGGYEELQTLERRLEETTREMATLAPEDPRLETLTAEYGELRERFESLGGDRIEARAKSVLSGLGVPEASFPEPIETLSGGWRMRVVLARLLLGTPGLLLLDEPTNHLDLEAIAWLEEFLRDYEGAFVVVSHDRYFLNRMVGSVVELERGRLATYSGNYDDYLVEKEAQQERLQKAARQQAREIAKTERFIERFRYKNTKARQVQSRIRALEKTERIRIEKSGRTIRFGFPPAPRSGDVAVRCEGLQKRFGDTVVYTDLDLLLRRGDRLALVGPNGAGKSTLLKMLAGRLHPDGGTLELGHNVIERYYAQHQLDALDPELTVLQEMEGVADPSLLPRLRSMLGSFLFAGDSVDKKVAVLSGGEKARLALCKMLVRPANLLLLDEPTNHLDLPSREILEDALNEYEGTLVLISHDRYFINRVVTSTALVGDGRAVLHDGDYDSFLEWQQRHGGVGPAAAGSASTPAPATTVKRERLREAKRAEAEERNRLYRERQARQRKLEPLEAKIAKLEARLRELTERQADPAVYRDADAARRIGRERSEVEQRLADLYGRWERLMEEGAGA